MTSWRATASQETQDDFDALLNTLLPFAEQQLSKHGEFFPFSAGVSAAGEVVFVATATESEHPDSSQVLEDLYAAVKAGGFRSAGFAADIRLNGGDAIRVELEHQDGVALALVAPYSRSRLTKKLSVGELSAHPGQAHIWKV